MVCLACLKHSGNQQLNPFNFFHLYSLRHSHTLRKLVSWGSSYTGGAIKVPQVMVRKKVRNQDMFTIGNKQRNQRPRHNIYTSISIASISSTGRMKFIPRWTPFALSPRKGTENTNDVRNSPLFLECCYFKIASTGCKAILIASPIFFVFLNTDF